MSRAQPASLEPAIWGPHDMWVMRVVKEEWQGVMRGQSREASRRKRCWAEEWGMDRSQLDNAGQGEGGRSIVRDPKGQRLRHEEQGTFLLGIAWSPDADAEIRRGRELRGTRLDQ